MYSIYAAGISPEDPLSVLEIGDVEPKPTPQEWVDVEVKAMSLNHHDVWALRGQALRAEQVPMILGTDAAGIAPDGTRVVVHAVIGTPVRGDETLDPKRSMYVSALCWFHTLARASWMHSVCTWWFLIRRLLDSGTAKNSLLFGTSSNNS